MQTETSLIWDLIDKFCHTSVYRLVTQNSYVECCVFIGTVLV